MAPSIIEEHVDFQPPAGDGWTSSPELPTADEIMRSQEENAIPSNDVRKPWATKDKYLEAQYKILRCEAVEGLRFSVKEYKESRCLKDDKLTCVYTTVFIRGYLFSRMGPIFRIVLSTERSKYRINWQLSKRLTPGTLVALSPKRDNFQTICKIATVAQRPIQWLTDGNKRPMVDLMWANPEDATFDPTEEFVMLESRSGYFEASRHALVGLQHAARTESPIDKYLVGHHKTDQTPPSVLQQPIMDLRSLIHVSSSEAPGAAELLGRHDILGGFPEIQGMTTLDRSQLSAVQRMLTKELAITQGPPGTGKTFTSVEALKILVANRRERGPMQPPIVVTAQTNHALDQLLRHSMRNGAQIMRLGGRTENTDMKPFTPFNLQQRRPKDTWEVAPDPREVQEKNATFNRLRGQHEKNVEEMRMEMSKWKSMSPFFLLKANVITRAQYKSLGVDATGPDFFGRWLPERCRKSAEDMFEWHVDLSQRHVDHEEDEFMYDHEEFEEDTGFALVVDEEDTDEHLIKGTYVPLLNWIGKLAAGKDLHALRFGSRPQINAELAKGNFFKMTTALRGDVLLELQRRMVASRAADLKRLLVKNVEICKGFKKNRWARDRMLAIGLNIDIIGCTTTGSTKYRGLLASLEPKILLVEEAAETREANIVSALYPSIEQLILVGDHKQLAPHYDIQWLANPPYNINVSLFERMVNLDMPFVMLDQQRRMVPAIREIIQPFYPDLKDHALVLDAQQRPPIPGMGHVRCWFLDHYWSEETDDNSSKYNRQEAEEIANFFRYLVRNGTPMDKITVLTYYNGQRKKLSEWLRIRLGTHPFNVCTIDAYQGEENDIILLSLVRSPEDSDKGPFNIGFLKNPQRAIVAMSRARRGLFVFGNMKNLGLAGDQESKVLWETIIAGFNRQGCINRSRGMPLVCNRHGRQIWAHGEFDWDINAGGCDRLCKQERPCGHACNLKCHPMDHSTLPCGQPCPKKLHCGHGCQRNCGDTCFCNCIIFNQPRDHGRQERTLEEMLEDSGATPGPPKAFEAAHTRAIEDAQANAPKDSRDRTQVAVQSVTSARPRAPAPPSAPALPKPSQSQMAQDTLKATQNWVNYAAQVRAGDLEFERQLAERPSRGPVQPIKDIYRPVTLDGNGRRVETPRRARPQAISVPAVSSSGTSPSPASSPTKAATTSQSAPRSRQNHPSRNHQRRNGVAMPAREPWFPAKVSDGSEPTLGWLGHINRDIIPPILDPSLRYLPDKPVPEAMPASSPEEEQEEPQVGTLIDLGDESQELAGDSAGGDAAFEDEEVHDDSDLMVFDDSDDEESVPNLIDI